LLRIIKVAKERVEKYFEDPEDEVAIKGFEGAKKWATENNIKEVLESPNIAKFFTRQRIIVLLTSVIVAGSIIFPLFLYAVNFIALFALDITGNHISREERVEKYFEDPEDESAIKGFEGAKKWATENNIKEVLEQISIYENALKDVEDDDEAVQEKLSSKYFSTLSFATLIILSNFSFSFSFSDKTFSS
jgi:hypothetical protein